MRLAYAFTALFFAGFLTIAGSNVEAKEKQPQEAAQREAAPAESIVPAPHGHFDEIFAPGKDDQGRSVMIVRPQYRDVVEAVRKLSGTRARTVAKDSVKDFSGDNALSLVPRIILDSDYDQIIKPGVDQRGRALRAFLQDFHRQNGRPEISRAGIFPQAVLDRIVARQQERGFVGQVNPESIALLYGPDMFRDKNGVFRVLEDNFGFLGGLGDLRTALSSLYKNVPEYPTLHEREPIDFYRTLVERYRARAKGGKVVLMTSPPYSDSEERRVKKHFAELGVPFVTPYTQAQLEFDSDGAWLRPEPGARRHRVGFIIAYGDVRSMDLSHDITSPLSAFDYSERLVSDMRKQLQRGNVSDEKRRAARKFMKVVDDRDATTGLPNPEKLEAALTELGHLGFVNKERRHSQRGFLEAVLRGRVATNYTPGNSIAEDKEFYSYVEKIIKFYLREEPILKNIKTIDARISLGNGRYGGFNEPLMDDLERNREKYVIKMVDGRGGEGIWVGAKISKSEFARGLKALRESPERYKIQPYTALSVFAGKITDLRVHSDIGPEGKVFVSDTGWARAISLEGDGKVNISSRGQEATVIVRSRLKFCPLLFQTTPPSAIFRP